jgi:MoaA/NifB/PqqE/SkfB family radical SAM enzyme
MNDYFCVLPYYSVETSFDDPGKNIYCCRIDPGTDIKSIRYSIENHSKSPACSTCWRLESQGLTSEREIHNRTMDFLLDLNMENIEKRSMANGFEPLQIKLTTSNLCNGTCVTCNSHLSSAWAQLENVSTKYRSSDFEQLDIDWGKIVSLSLLGGEPLLEKKNFAILEKLIALGNTNCFVSFVTNGSIELSDKQIGILKQFAKLNICISIDGTDKSFEYMRFPLKWDRLLHNLSIFKSLTHDVSVSCMISNLNVYYYSDMIEFFESRGLNYLCKQVEQPSIFAPGNLPDSLKHMILERNKSHKNQVAAFLRIGRYSPELYSKFKNEVQRQNQLKQITLEDYLPALANLL